MAFSFNDDMVRLHVIASNDTEKSQRLKMRVVMAVRKRAARLVYRAIDAGEAFEILKRSAKDIYRSARVAAMRAGYFGKIAVDCGVYAFPDCAYTDALVPAGDYRAVRVSIGKAAGHNWWCVLYPELCAVDQSIADVLLNGDTVNFFSSIALFFENLFGGVGL